MIFLDIDGVLLTARTYLSIGTEDEWHFDEVVVQFLKTFCHKNCYDIVISSTWKHHFNRLYKLLSESGLIYNLIFPDNLRASCTPNINLPYPPDRDDQTVCWGRGEEIQRYLDSLSPVFNYEKDLAIIIDDDSYDILYYSKFPNFKLITPDTQEGISSTNMREMLEFAEANKPKWSNNGE